MEVGKIEQLTTERPPRTMPHMFARQEDTIRRLQVELDAANESVNQWMEYYHNAAAEKDALLNWSRRADNALHIAEQTADHTTIDLIRKVRADAPDAVKGGDK